VTKGGACRTKKHSREARPDSPHAVDSYVLAAFGNKLRLGNKWVQWTSEPANYEQDYRHMVHAMSVLMKYRLVRVSKV